MYKYIIYNNFKHISNCPAGLPRHRAWAWGWVAARSGGFGPCWSARICDLKATCDRGPKKSCELARTRVTSLHDRETKMPPKSSQN